MSPMNLVKGSYSLINDRARIVRFFSCREARFRTRILTIDTKEKYTLTDNKI